MSNSIHTVGESSSFDSHDLDNHEIIPVSIEDIKKTIYVCKFKMLALLFRRFYKNLKIYNDAYACIDNRDRDGIPDKKDFKGAKRAIGYMLGMLDKHEDKKLIGDLYNLLKIMGFVYAHVFQANNEIYETIQKIKKKLGQEMDK